MAKDFRPILKEGPRAMGMMSVVVESGGSLDSAVRGVAENGPATIRKLFSDIVHNADTRTVPDIRSGLEEMLSSLPKELSGFRRSMHLLMAASELPSGSEKTRILKEATDISLDGLKDAGERFSSSLSNPCMLIFGLGVMTPMIMMSVLPLLQLGKDMDGTMTPFPMIFTILVAVPAVVLTISAGISKQNPFGSGNGDRDFSGLAVYALSPLLGIAGWFVFKDLLQVLILATVPVGIIAFVRLRPSIKNESKRKETETMLYESVFELGNRLISGNNFENSAIDALESKKETSGISETFRKEMVLCRGDVETAVYAALTPVSPAVAETYAEIYRSSLKNLRDAGRLAISMGRQIQDRETVMKNIINKLKSMLDMMTATAAVFAPLVLGLCMAMLKPLTAISEAADMSGVSYIIGIYLIELCALMAIFTVALTGKNDVSDMTYRFSMMLPISMTVFFLSMGLVL
jgi:hypothetical protein